MCLVTVTMLPFVARSKTICNVEITTAFFVEVFEDRGALPLFLFYNILTVRR